MQLARFFKQWAIAKQQTDETLAGLLRQFSRSTVCAFGRTLPAQEMGQSTAALREHIRKECAKKVAGNRNRTFA